MSDDFDAAIARGAAGFQRDCQQAGVTPRYDAAGRIVLSPDDLRALINVAPADRRGIYEAMLDDSSGTGGVEPDGQPQRPN